MPGWSSFLGFAQKALKSPAVKQLGTSLVQRYAGRAGRIAGTAGRIAGAGAAFEVGSRVVRGAFGEEEPGYGYARRRRINPMNSRAAMRAIRRITQVRKILRKIEGKMPKARCKRCAGGGGRRRVCK